TTRPVASGRRRAENNNVLENRSKSARSTIRQEYSRWSGRSSSTRGTERPEIG
ncbi:unnamed protein product, partial [Nesidiocoris tenuis]